MSPADGVRAIRTSTHQREHFFCSSNGIGHNRAMTSRPAESPVSVVPDFVRRVAEVFRRTEFDEASIRSYLADRVELVPVTAESLPRFIRAANGRGPIDTLLRLFAFEGVVSEVDVADAITPMSPAEWVDGGLLERALGGYRAAVRISPQQGVLVAFDRLEPGQNRRPDYVMGMAKTSGDLLFARVSGYFERVLDLGTGCGVTALSRAAHSGHTIATDILERAGNFSRFNVLLNGVTNVDVRVGDLLTPVAGQTFDLITMNAPHVITPDGGVAYRDGGYAGEGFVRRLARELPKGLAPGGFCQFTAQWLEFDGESWQDRLQTWFHDSGCDVWVLRTRRESPETHSESFITELEAHTPESYARQVDRWVSWFEAEGASHVSAGVITVRRREGTNWFFANDVDGLDTHSGAGIRRGFDIRDFLVSAEPDVWLTTAFIPAQDLLLRTLGRPTGNGWSTSELTLDKPTGLRSTAEVDGATAQLIGLCDGKRPLGDIIEAIANAARAPLEVVLPGILAAVRQLAERDMLWPNIR